MPGYEFNVEKIFREKLLALKEKNAIFDFWTFKLFGLYDLAIIYECAEFKQDILFVGVIPNIIKSTEFFSFPWHRNNKSSFSKKLMAKANLGITFFKIRSEILDKAGKTIEDIEHPFVDIITKTKDCSCFCSLGWSEFIVFTHTDNVEEMIVKINANLGNIVYKSSNGEIINLPLKTFSMIGVNYSFLRSKKKLYKHFGKSTISEGIKLSINVTCDIAHMENIKDYIAKEFFGKKRNVRIYSVFGTKDICFDIDKNTIKNWGKFIYKLLKFRFDEKTKLFSTFVEISTKRFNVFEANTVIDWDSSIIYLTERKIKALSNKLQHLVNPVISTIYSFNELLQNRIISDCYRDMTRFVADLLFFAYDSHPVKINLTDEIPRRVSLIKYGTNQRSSGAFLNIEYQGELQAIYKGGLQRILQSAESLPHYVYKKIYNGETWPGFVTIGYQTRYWHAASVLNIPSDMAFSPEKWWGLFHEIGHIYAIANIRAGDNVFTFQDKSFLKTFKSKLGFDKNEPERFNEAIKNITEAASDIFDYSLFHGKDFIQYIRVIWNYLNGEMKTDSAMKSVLSFYIFRSFFTNIFSKLYSEQELELKSLDYVKTQSLYDDFINILPKETFSALNGKAKNALKLSVIDNFARYKWALPFISKWINQINFDFFNAAEASRINDEIIPLLRQGIVVPVVEINNPALMIIQIKRFILSNRRSLSKEELFKFRMATLLTLWYFYQNNKG